MEGVTLFSGRTVFGEPNPPAFWITPYASLELLVSIRLRVWFWVLGFKE